MKRKQLSKSETKEISTQVRELYGQELVSRKDVVEQVDDGFSLIVVNKQPLFFLFDGAPVPTLKALLHTQMLKSVTVDMGAVKFVTQGADIMLPGIIDLDLDLKKDDFVVIVDEIHKKPLAVGVMLVDGEAAEHQEKGKVVRNIHQVGDKIWSFS